MTFLQQNKLLEIINKALKELTNVDLEQTIKMYEEKHDEIQTNLSSQIPHVSFQAEVDMMVMDACKKLLIERSNNCVIDPTNIKN